MALRVVANVDERLARGLRHLEALEQVAGRRPLLDDGRKRLSRSAVRVPDGIRAAVGDAGEQGLSCERPIDGRVRTQAVASYTAHKEETVWTPSDDLLVVLSL